jgi:homoserine O-acetyltransferase
VIGVTEDLLFPVEQQRAVARLLTDVGIDTTFLELSSPYGHDAFLVEEQAFTRPIARFLDEPGIAARVAAAAAASRAGNGTDEGR